MLIRGRRDVVYETTLAGTNALRVIDRAKVAGYTIEAVFVAVPSADLAIGRVAQRTAAGGLFVPPAAVRRRYERSFDNLPGLVARADVTTVYDNTELSYTTRRSPWTRSNPCGVIGRAPARMRSCSFMTAMLNGAFAAIWCARRNVNASRSGAGTT